jgi:hypothetical protein
VPTTVTSGAQERLRPCICFIAEDRPRCPVMVLGTVSSANLAFVARSGRFDVLWMKTGCPDSLFRYEMLSSCAAGTANEQECFMTALINTSPNLPGPQKAALFARVGGPLDFSIARHVVKGRIHRVHAEPRAFISRTVVRRGGIEPPAFALGR